MSPPAEIIVQTGNWYGPWLSVGAVLVSALVAARVALHSINTQRAIARRRATLDMLTNKEWDVDYIKARAHFTLLRDSEGGLHFWADKQHKGSPQAAFIRSIMNDYELIAIGIREDILDEALFRRWFKTSFLIDWRASRQYVGKIRLLAGTNAIFSEIDWLAERWGEPVQRELPLGIDSELQRSGPRTGLV